MACDCSCQCPQDLNCSCGCTCPMTPVAPAPSSDPNSCSLGYTRVCPRAGDQCPDGMLHLCPADIFSYMERNSRTTMSSVDKTLTTTIISKTITVKTVKFRCKFTLVHSYFNVALRQSKVDCSPSQPKNQKVNNLVVFSGGYRFRVSFSINPSKLTVAIILVSPPTTTAPPPTTTLFSFADCQCEADFVLYFAQQAMMNKQPANRGSIINLVWHTAPHSDLTEGSPSLTYMERKLSLRAGDLFLSACYCVQASKMNNTGINIQQSTTIGPRP